MDFKNEDVKKIIFKFVDEIEVMTERVEYIEGWISGVGDNNDKEIKILLKKAWDALYDVESEMHKNYKKDDRTIERFFGVS